MASVWSREGGLTGARILQAPPVAAAAAPQPRAEPVIRPQDMQAYRHLAIHMTMEMLDIKEQAGTHALCHMFYLDNNQSLQAVSAHSGEPSNNQKSQILALRTSALTQIQRHTQENPLDKTTYCAEEFLLIQNPGKRFLFSWTFDGRLLNDVRQRANIPNGQANKGQMVRACCKACRGILESKNIEDLVATQHW